MTTFIRVLDASVETKPTALLRAIRENEGVEVDPVEFGQIPGSPFSYWVSAEIRKLFSTFEKVESDLRRVRQGLGTADDFRFVRGWWEIAELPSSVNARWYTFVRGGRTSPYYGDVDCVLNWAKEGAELKSWASISTAGGHWSKNIRSTDLYFRAGLTWPLRASRFAPYPIPKNSIFSIRGYAFIADEARLLGALGMFSSSTFDFLFKTMLGRHGHPEFIVGILQHMPWAEPSKDVGKLARRAWSLKRSLDTGNETSHAFLLPRGALLTGKVTANGEVSSERELADIQARVDDLTFRLYGISAEDRLTIEAPTRTPTSASNDIDAEAPEDADEGEDETTVGGGTDALASWLVGVAFGRFDPRLATGERPIPHEPEPFDPLPARSPGMYPVGEDPADRPDILVDDEGHPDDLAARAIAVAERVKVDAPENLRAWLAKEFFPLHIKMYSRSRRKAPIYWQLATPSASYSVWLYIHAFSKDTLFRVQNDYVAPKLAHEERRLESLTSELRDGATAAQRKTLAAQEAVVDELRAFLDEVKRVAPLWKPNLDDGVLINFASLWRLVPQNKSWQKELKSTWDTLCEGKYDWAHLAMYLWPERVVPKCAKDRSLAIAHGLEDVFWVEGADGKWTARKTPTRSVDELVRERTSPAVKSALKSLLEAPTAAGKSGGRKAGGRRKVESAEADG